MASACMSRQVSTSAMNQCDEAIEHYWVLHGESNIGQASPRTPTQRTIQPQESAQPQRNQTTLQPDTPARKANYSYKWSHPTPHEADARTSHVQKNAPSCAQSPGGRPPSTCTHRTSQPAKIADATTIRTPPASCQLTGPTDRTSFVHTGVLGTI